MTNENDVVLYSLDDGVARVRLNRPEKRNALNDELIAALKVALNQADQDEETRVILLSGEGKDFCSGADLSALQEISEGSVSENAADARSLVELFVQMRRVRVPIVAAVRGKALAGGCGLASACDLVLASSSARFGYPEVKIGFVPAIVLAILRRNISEKRAFELLTRGEETSAEEAKALGLVNQVFSEEKFAEEIAAYVKKFTEVSKSAVSLTKTLLYQVDGLSFIEALETGADVNVIARLTEDCQKGIARFLKK
ncbi:MAG TPA: enoyl-CoA hydratase/isomerase family protein [Pyrinomonadaceae bacterium]|nr:enoyl-CoA hydratase/isomerase family protein [Pyrinomonadaceae bacterium]